ncbi:hypothetical protein BJ742DRAFT_788500 [Cladochytrium replicatum]|nr:hypothetical protein BJ742DRAFT_788500 [Cladochytrium replicatum]
MPLNRPIRGTHASRALTWWSLCRMLLSPLPQKSIAASNQRGVSHKSASVKGRKRVQSPPPPKDTDVELDEVLGRSVLKHQHELSKPLKDPTPIPQFIEHHDYPLQNQSLASHPSPWTARKFDVRRTPLARPHIPYLDPTTTRSKFRDALQKNDAAGAWAIYKTLYALGEVAAEGKAPGARRRKLSPSQLLTVDDHASMLGLCCTHRSALMGAVSASRVFFNIKKQSLTPGVREYNALMYCHLRNRDYPRVEETFNVMEIELEEQRSLLSKDGTSTPLLSICYTPTVRSYNLLLASLALSGRAREAQNVYDDMVADLPGSEADVEAQSLLMEAYGNAGDVQKAWTLFESLVVSARAEWEDQGEGDASSLQVAPRFKRAWDAMIRVFGVNRMLDRALGLFTQGYSHRSPLQFERMEKLPAFVQSNRYPDEETFDAIIEACTISGDVEAASTLWKELLIQSNRDPESDGKHALKHLRRQSDSSDHSEESGPPLVQLHSILEALLPTTSSRAPPGLPQLSYPIGSEPDALDLRSVITPLQLRDAQRSPRFLNPLPSTYRRMMFLHRTSNPPDLARVWKLFEGFSELWSPSEAVYHEIIWTCLASGDAGRAKRWLDAMMAAGFRPAEEVATEVDNWLQKKS